MNTASKDVDFLIDRALMAMTLIDEKINNQLNEICNHPLLMSLEAAWRSLHMLAHSIPSGAPAKVKIRILNISKAELIKDLALGQDFEMSHVFRKVNDYEYGQAGGEPYGAMLLDFWLNPRRTRYDARHDPDILLSLAKIGQFSFCPFITACHASFFSSNSFSDISMTHQFGQHRTGSEMRDWTQLQKNPASRFLVMLLPYIMSRRDNDFVRLNLKPLEQNPIYEYGKIILKCFLETGWFIRIQDFSGFRSGGGITRLESSRVSGQYQKPDDEGGPPALAFLASTTQADDLRRSGMIAMVPLKNSRDAIFAHHVSVYEGSLAFRSRKNEKDISGLIPYLLCSCRFAHYIKILIRDKIGLFSDFQDLQKYLQKWLVDYVDSGATLTSGKNTRFPLKEGRIILSEKFMAPGTFQCRMWLRPHFYLEQLSAIMHFDSVETHDLVIGGNSFNE